MFPNYLDNAKVLEHTEKGHFGFITDYNESNTPVVKEICYYAICHYEVDGDGYYIFSCDNQFDVLNDSLLYSVAQCKESLHLPSGTIWYKK